jgi:hypothetical protein
VSSSDGLHPGGRGRGGEGVPDAESRSGGEVVWCDGVVRT